MNSDERRQRSANIWWAGIGLLTAVILTFVLAGPLDALLRYGHFKLLTKEKLVTRVKPYLEQFTEGSVAACLYVVSCESGTARLSLVKDINTIDVEAIKTNIWKRRFSHFCEGRTANLALYALPPPGQAWPYEESGEAVWAFFNDKFLPTQRRFDGSSFSEEPWERCTSEYALR